MNNESSIEQIRLLTQRELTVGKLMVQGQTNKEIARALKLTPGTVKNYSSNIIHKLGAVNRVEAAVILERSGLFTCDEIDIKSDLINCICG